MCGVGRALRCAAAQLPGVAVSSRSVAAEPGTSSGDTCYVVTRYAVIRYVVTRDTLCCDTRGHGSRDEEGASQARPRPGPASRVSITRVETRKMGLSDYFFLLLPLTNSLVIPSWHGGNTTAEEGIIMSSADNFTVTRTPFQASLGLHNYLHNVSCQVTSASQLQSLKKLHEWLYEGW